MQWCDRLSGPPQTPYKLVPIPRLFDQLLLLPMRLGLSVLLTSTAMVVSPMTIANQGPVRLMPHSVNDRSSLSNSPPGRTPISACSADLPIKPASSSASMSGRSRKVSMPNADRKCFVVT